jgi:hypothetical protein
MMLNITNTIIHQIFYIRNNPLKKKQNCFFRKQAMSWIEKIDFVWRGKYLIHDFLIYPFKHWSFDKEEINK